MREKLRFWGLDVHAETIAVAVAETDGEVRSLGTIPNRAESIRKMIKKLGPAEKGDFESHALRVGKRVRIVRNESTLENRHEQAIG
jgi:hypothetical protein